MTEKAFCRKKGQDSMCESTWFRGFTRVRDRGLGVLNLFFAHGGIEHGFLCVRSSLCGLGCKVNRIVSGYGLFMCKAVKSWLPGIHGKGGHEMFTEIHHFEDDNLCVHSFQEKQFPSNALDFGQVSSARCCHTPLQ